MMLLAAMLLCVVVDPELRAVKAEPLVRAMKFLHDGTAAPLMLAAEPLSPETRDLWRINADDSLTRVEVPLLPNEHILDADAREGRVWLLTSQSSVLRLEAGSSWRRIELGPPREGEARPPTWVGHARIDATPDGAVVARPFREGSTQPSSPAFLDLVVLDLSTGARRQVLDGWLEETTASPWSAQLDPFKKGGPFVAWQEGEDFKMAGLDLPSAAGGAQLVRDAAGQVWVASIGTRARGRRDRLVRTAPGQAVDPVPLPAQSHVRALVPARAQGVLALLDVGGDQTVLLHLGGAQNEAAIPVPIARVNFRGELPPLITEPIEGELWVQPSAMSGRELVRLREAHWQHFRLASDLAVEASLDERALQVARIRAVLPWLEKLRPFALIAIELGLLLGALLTFRWRQQQPTPRPIAWMVLAASLAALGAFVVNPLLQLGSDRHLPQSLAPSFDFLEWWLEALVLGSVAVVVGSVAAGTTARLRFLVFSLANLVVWVLVWSLSSAGTLGADGAVASLALTPVLTGLLLRRLTDR